MEKEKSKIPEELFTATGEECLRNFKDLTGHLQISMTKRREENDRNLKKRVIEARLERFAKDLAHKQKEEGREEIRKNVEGYLLKEVADENERREYQGYFEQSVKVFSNPRRTENPNPYGIRPVFWRDRR